MFIYSRFIASGIPSFFCGFTDAINEHFRMFSFRAHNQRDGGGRCDKAATSWEIRISRPGVYSCPSGGLPQAHGLCRTRAHSRINTCPSYFLPPFLTHMFSRTKPIRFHRLS